MAFSLVRELAGFLGIDCPDQQAVIESLVYMDNLGLTWVSEQQEQSDGGREKDIILKEFSSFRTPLGDAVASVIAPPGFFLDNIIRKPQMEWPVSHVSSEFRNAGMRSGPH
jgi:hypothetical protein